MKVLEPKCHVEQYLGKPPMQVTVSYKLQMETTVIRKLVSWSN